ncbi:Mu transposase C-terminal domain-containing protein [Primorskyibacter sp. S87]|uniref:Mu transposase C-terminal domain-containing protein n=1 Tax=Primorskyibacter sp. S87 TaxID=3415126 RepID=UPI003C7BD9A1
MIDAEQSYVGWQIIVESEPYVIDETDHRHNRVVLRDEDGTQREITSDEFRELFALGAVAHPSGPSASSRRLGTPEENSETRFRELVLRRSNELKQQGYSLPKRRKKIMEELEAHPLLTARKKPFPSVRTMQAWRKEYLEKGKDGLRSKSFKSGNRTARYDFEFREVVLDLLEKHFIENDLKSIAWISRQAERIYLRQCKVEEKTPGPYGRKCVEAIVYALPHAGLLRRRAGDEEADKRYLMALEYQRISTPLERVELDCTVLDLWCVDDDGNPIGRPYVCVAIDCATGIILGMQLSWSRPDAAFVSRTVKEILEPKSPEFFLMHGIENDFQTFGTPQLLITDQGSENSGDVLQSVIDCSSLEWRKMIPGRPDKKPFIERFFLELSRFVTQYPGASQTSVIGPRDRTEKAKLEACLTLQQVETLLQRWRYDVYARMPRRRVQNVLRTIECPMQSWKRTSLECFLPLPPTPHQLREMFMVQAATRSAQRYGIPYRGVTYHSPELASYLKRVGVPTEVDIRIDPNDIREIAVLDYLSGEHFFVPAKYEECPALSFDELARLRKKTRTPEDEELKEKALIAAMALHLYEEQSKAKTTTARSKEKAAKQQRRHDILAQSRKAMERTGVTELPISNEIPKFEMPQNMPSFVNKGGES